MNKFDFGTRLTREEIPKLHVALIGTWVFPVEYIPIGSGYVWTYQSHRWM